MSEAANYCICRQCRKEIKTQLFKCVPCDKEFHPSCHKLHKVYNMDNELMNCNGKYEILTIKDKKSDESSVTMKRTLSTDESQQGGTSMEKKIDWLVYKMKDDMVSKKEIKNMIIDVVKFETEKLRKEMEEMKMMIEKYNKAMKDELHKMMNARMEKGEIKKSYSEVLKENQTESVLVIKPKDGEENKSSEDTKRDVRKIDITKLGVGITKIKKVTRGAIVIGCENKVQAEKLKQEVVKDLGKKYEIQVPKKRKPKVKIFDVDIEDCENEQILWEKIEEQNGMQKNTIEGKILRKVTKANYKKMMIIVEVNTETREKFLKMEKLKIGWSMCKVQDYIGIIRCYKCCGYYHFAKDCTKKETCGNCANQHTTKECKSEIKKCVNCEEKIKSYRIKNLKSDHSAYDSNCPCLKKEIEKQREKIQCNDI